MSAAFLNQGRGLRLPLGIFRPLCGGDMPRPKPSNRGTPHLMLAKVERLPVYVTAADARAIINGAERFEGRFGQSGAAPAER